MPRRRSTDLVSTSWVTALVSIAAMMTPAVALYAQHRGGHHGGGGMGGFGGRMGGFGGGTGGFHGGSGGFGGFGMQQHHQQNSFQQQRFAPQQNLFQQQQQRGIHHRPGVTNSNGLGSFTPRTRTGAAGSTRIGGNNLGSSLGNAHVRPGHPKLPSNSLADTLRRPGNHHLNAGTLGKNLNSNTLGQLRSRPGQGNRLTDFGGGKATGLNRGTLRFKPNQSIVHSLQRSGGIRPSTNSFHHGGSITSLARHHRPHGFGTVLAPGVAGNSWWAPRYGHGTFGYGAGRRFFLTQRCGFPIGLPLYWGSGFGGGYFGWNPFLNTLVSDPVFYGNTPASQVIALILLSNALRPYPTIPAGPVYDPVVVQTPCVFPVNPAAGPYLAPALGQTEPVSSAATVDGAVVPAAGDGPSNLVEASQVVPQSDSDTAARGRRLVLLNPADSGAAVNFTIDSVTYTIDPGRSRELTGADSWSVEFDKGARSATARYTLTQGTYTFTPTETGWDLFRTRYTIILDNSANFGDFHYVRDGQEETVQASGSQEITSNYPVVIAFDRGDGGDPAERSLASGTYRIGLANDGRAIEVIAAMTPQ